VLEIDDRVILPLKAQNRVLVTLAGVLLSWAVPCLDVKVDYCPGRLNQICLLKT
ncbi:unnamed protein product, partial [Choristocarpus tenellus]